MPVANSTQLVAPTRLFARLKDDLAPFIYEVPPAFSEHLAVLKQLGCRDSPTPADLLDTLKVRPPLPTRLPRHQRTTPHVFGHLLSCTTLGSGKRWLLVLSACWCSCQKVCGTGPNADRTGPPLQRLRETHGGGCLSINELRTVISLLGSITRDAKVQQSLDKLRRRGELLVPGLDGSLQPAHHCVHALTTPRTLLQRCASDGGLLHQLDLVPQHAASCAAARNMHPARRNLLQICTCALTSVTGHYSLG